VKECEYQKMLADECLLKGDYNGAENNLRRIQLALQKLNTNDLKFLAPKVFPEAAAKLLITVLDELEENIVIEIASIAHKKASEK